LARHQDFDIQLRQVRETIQRYRSKISEQHTERLSDSIISDYQQELQTLGEMEGTLGSIERLSHKVLWATSSVQLEEMQFKLDELSRLAAKLPRILQTRMQSFASDVRLKYRSFIITSWITSSSAVLLLIVMTRLFYVWVLAPLRLLIHGSRLVAGGNFYHRIHLNSQDEMSELAQAMNGMTSRFQQIRDDLDQQVQQRTREVVRGEQLASVGFLAAGVAHEINNPLAAIALCAESLEDRLDEVIQTDDTLPDTEHNESITVLRTYLRMIQDEAFRCKKITEGLLDFSQLGNACRECVNLSEIVEDTAGMLRHLGTCKDKELLVNCPEPVFSVVNAQEFRQVLLNLITNALDSLDAGGCVRVSLQARDHRARLTVADNGCGMTEEVRKNLFEPFFTRRRSGTGTGLGLAITNRIVHDHHGTISADSAGPGLGSTLVVTFPLSESNPENAKEVRYHYQAA
jgi:signal transduction histidine kinase